MQKGIRVNGPGANLSMDFEPEYITVSPDSLTAYVAIQEANAIAVLDVEAGQFTEIMPMGYKPHSSVQQSTHPWLGRIQESPIHPVGCSSARMQH